MHSKNCISESFEGLRLVFGLNVSKASLAAWIPEDPRSLFGGTTPAFLINFRKCVVSFIYLFNVEGVLSQQI